MTRIDLDGDMKSGGAGLLDISWQYSATKDDPAVPALTTVVLGPGKGAQLATFEGGGSTGAPTINAKRSFDEITVTELLGLNYGSVAIGGTFRADFDVNPLPVGLIFAVRTSEGNYAKVEVLESSATLRIKWVTYKNPNPQPTPPTAAPQTPQAASASGSLAESASLLSSHPVGIGVVGLADFGPGGTSVVVAGEVNGAVVVETASGKPIARLPTNSSISAARLSSDGRRALIVERKGNALVWGLKTGVPTTSLLGSESNINDAVFSDDGRRVATGGDDNMLRIYDTATGALVTPPINQHSDVSALAFTPDDNRVVTAGKDNKLRIYDAATGALLQTLPVPGNDIRKLLVSHDGKYIATLDVGKHVSLLAPSADEGKWQPDAEFTFAEKASDLAFSPNSRFLTIACDDGKVRVWSMINDEVAYLLNEIRRGDPLRSVLGFSPGGKMLLVASERGTAILWNWMDVSPTTFVELPGHTGRVVSGSFSPDETRVYTAGADGTVRTWELKTVGSPTRGRGHR